MESYVLTFSFLGFLSSVLGIILRKCEVFQCTAHMAVRAIQMTKYKQGKGEKVYWAIQCEITAYYTTKTNKNTELTLCVT